MRPRSVQTAPQSGAKKSRANYGEQTRPAKAKSEVSAREAADTGRRSAQKTTPKRKPISSDVIARRAHSIWESEGWPEGRDQEFWFRAEVELKNEQAVRAAL